MSNRFHSPRRDSAAAPEANQRAELLFPLEGRPGAPIDTYAHRDLIKEHGGRWDSQKRVWMVPHSKLALLLEFCAVSAGAIRRRDAARTSRRLEEERLFKLRSEQAVALRMVRDCLAKLGPAAAAITEAEWQRLALGALDEAQKLELVKANGLALKYLPEPSQEFELLAVQQDGLALPT
ncbi:DUF4116 domain-containing protein [Sabulicella glaciei]|uniref:DUF5710 domain-containing protein n=1 Tax=Sabulicella glaciei TaxID=2984948 RepID=A0ABT3NZH9_9PROT|nr:hypothetical protein [Roseococcus sp. MDT2-1-1]MCW8087577.1 hypothetical protein [Roseococcus sp. MDT2-1-1]